MGVIGTRTDTGFTEIRTSKFEDLRISFAKKFLSKDRMWRIIHRIEKKRGKR